MTDSIFFLAHAANNLNWLRLRSNGEGISNTLAGEVILAIAVVSLVAGVVLYVRARLRSHSMVQELDDARMKVLTNDLNLTRTEMELVQTLAGQASTAELLDLMEDRATFESVVRRFREANPEHPALRRVSQLRQRLQFGFSNLRNGFVDTRMLAPGMRLRCRIRLRKREVSFLTTVLAVNENQFAIRPLVVKGKVLPLGRLPRLGFHVSRDHDAEYEFTCPVQGQLDAAPHAVLCGHTLDIQRMLFRNADRVQVDLPVQCFLIRQDIASDRTATSLRAQDAQTRFEGRIKDISIGGALLFAEITQDKVAEGDVVLFALNAALLKFDLVAQAVGVVPQDEAHLRLNLQFLGLREMDRLKLGKYLVGLKEKGAPVTPGSRSAEPPVRRAT